MKTINRLATVNKDTQKTRYYINGVRVSWERYFDTNMTRIDCMITKSTEKHIRHYSIGYISN